MKRFFRIALITISLLLFSSCYFATGRRQRAYAPEPECLATVQYWHRNIITWNSCNDWIRVYWSVPFPHLKKK